MDNNFWKTYVEEQKRNKTKQKQKRNRLLTSFMPLPGEV